MRKLILAAVAVGTLAAPTVAMAATGHKTPAKATSVHVCVSHKKHGLRARLYTASPSTVPLNVGSVYSANTGCTPGASFDPSAQAVNATGSTVLPSFSGPLTITR